MSSLKIGYVETTRAWFRNFTWSEKQQVHAYNTEIEYDDLS